MGKIKVLPFAIAWGVSFGVYALFLGWVSVSGWGEGIVYGLSSLYIGYEPGFLGGIIGGIWAFFVGSTQGG